MTFSVSLDEAARVLGVSRRVVYRRIRDGFLSTIRVGATLARPQGGSQRVLADSLEIERLRDAKFKRPAARP